jgi:tetratricopeptide (TPR) repeat protein
LPALFEARLAKQACNARPNWGEIASEAYGKAADNLAMAMNKIKCDPLLFGAWMRGVSANIWLGDFDEAIDLATQALEQVPHRRITGRLITAYIATGRFDDAQLLIDRDLVDDRMHLGMRLTLAAARGDAENTKRLVDELMVVHRATPTFPIMDLAVAGERDLANQLAAELDALPYGYLKLMTHPVNCVCGAPWDLEVTPNFAKLLKDAELSWPPASPINWPLKDW